MESSISDTHPALATLFAAATKTAADLLHLLALLTANGMPNFQERKAIRAVWIDLLRSHGRLTESFYLDVGGAKVHHCLDRLRRSRAKLGRFRANSHLQALSRASSNLLDILHRRSNVNAWQKGVGCSSPSVAAMKLLVASWRPLQSDVVQRFRGFPRRHARIADKILREIILIEGLNEQEVSTREASDSRNQSADPALRMSESKASRPSLTPLEQHIVKAIHGAGHRMTTKQIQNAVFDRYKSQSSIKQCLAAMVTHGMLDNSKAAKPPGYGLILDPTRSEWMLNLDLTAGFQRQSAN